MNLATAYAKKRGGVYRLKNKEEIESHGREEYEKLKIQPRNHNEYRTLHSYVIDFLKLFQFPLFTSSPPEEWSQYTVVQCVDQNQNTEEVLEFLSRLGFWSVFDDESFLIDLADVDIKILEKVLPYELFSFKTISCLGMRDVMVTPEHFHIEYPKPSVVDQKIFRERKPREKKVVRNDDNEVPTHLNGVEVVKVDAEEMESDQEEQSSQQSKSAEFFSFPIRKGVPRKPLVTLSELSAQHSTVSLVAKIPLLTSDLRKQYVQEVFAPSFGVEHRLEQIAVIEGVEYWNDSMATNVNSVWYALGSIQGPIIWICGGLDKGNDYTSLLSVVKEKVKGIVCLAKDPSKIRSAFSQTTSFFIETESMETAVRQAYAWSMKGDRVVFSPGCASFDLFENFEDRGQQFRHAVRSI